MIEMTPGAQYEIEHPETTLEREEAAEFNASPAAAIRDWGVEQARVADAFRRAMLKGVPEPIELAQHDCGVYYVVGQAHVCPDVELPHEANRAIQRATVR